MNQSGFAVVIYSFVAIGVIYTLLMRDWKLHGAIVGGLFWPILLGFMIGDNSANMHLKNDKDSDA
jgi:hypothetical protein